MGSIVSSRSTAVGVVAGVAALVLVGCRSDDGPTVGTPPVVTTDPGLSPTSATTEQRYPDVMDVVVEEESDGSFAFAVTISSPYDSPVRYADGWRIVGPNGTVFGEHTLTHDHANEQPFTRTQRSVKIPPAVDSVSVEGRDLEHGYGGAVVSVTLGR